VCEEGAFLCLSKELLEFLRVSKISDINTIKTPDEWVITCRTDGCFVQLVHCDTEEEAKEFHLKISMVSASQQW